MGASAPAAEARREADLDAPTEPPAEDSIGGLIQELIDNGKELVRAEANLYRELASYRLGKAKSGLIAIGIAAVLALCGLFALVFGLMLGLALLVGPVASGAILFAACVGIAYLLFRYAGERLTGLAGDNEEEAALMEGERRA